LPLLFETLFSAAKYKFARRTVKRSFAKSTFFQFVQFSEIDGGRPQMALAEG
jgi:hypothetical protein